MKKIVILLFLIIIFIIPMVSYHDCSSALPPENPPSNWAESCPKNKKTIFLWTLEKIKVSLDN